MNRRQSALGQRQDAAPAGARPGSDPVRAPGDVPASAASRVRGLVRWGVQRLAVLAALLVLFYATSLHGLNARTLILAGVLALGLYWLFNR